MAEAPPPPLQIAATPILPLFCFKTESKVTIILQPELPSGCPKATAPPFTFTLVASSFKAWLLAKATTEKASLIS